MFEIYGKSNPYWKIFQIFSPKDKDKGLNRHPHYMSTIPRLSREPLVDQPFGEKSRQNADEHDGKFRAMGATSQYNKAGVGD
jgi:hypothetical protein